MATPDRVNPGELITADLMNDILKRLKILEDKAAAPGTTPGVVRITAMVPAGTLLEPIRVGQTLQILGENFGYFAGQASVTFERPTGNVVIQNNQMLTGSSDTRLLMTVPSLSGLSQGGENMTLRVRSGTTDDHRSVFVRPVVIVLQGDIFVDWRTDTPNPSPNPLVSSLATPQSASFSYRLRTATNLPATFDLSATISNATTAVPAGMESSIQFLDESGNLIPNRQLQMGTNDTRNIVVRIPQVPASFASQSFKLNVDVASGGLTGGDGRSFTVGVAVTPPDSAIEAIQTGSSLTTPDGESDTDPASGSFDGTTIRLKPGKRMMLIFTINKLMTIGTYDVSITQKTGTSGWAPELVTTITPIQVQTEADKTQPRLAQFRITAAPSSVNGSVLFKIKRQGSTSDFSKEYGVVKLS